ncbi:fluoride efflux transporter FluC [Haloparvum sp. AD34]
MERRAAGFGLVAVGGVVGAVARYAVAVVLGATVGTLAVNVVGAFALGLLVTRATDVRTQLLVGTGALSSFTTYSTFAAETVVLGTLAGTGYVAATYAGGLAAAAAGIAVGRRFR